MAGLMDVLEGIAKNPEVAEKFKDTKSPQDVVDLVKEHGAEIAIEEVHKIISEKGGSGLIDHLFK